MELGILVKISSPGTCSITASQAGNSNYLAAKPVTQSFHVLNVQTINFGSLSSRTYGDPPVHGQRNSQFGPASELYFNDCERLCDIRKCRKHGDHFGCGNVLDNRVSGG